MSRQMPCAQRARRAGDAGRRPVTAASGVGMAV
ncbi:hypothetical protein BPC006_I1438 [Burkholderia pseudomallei BPC006]|nr:hypothetical protein BPC006_I1438 [Burkholderia pseudomallei BPC006]